MPAISTTCILKSCNKGVKLVKRFITDLSNKRSNPHANIPLHRALRSCLIKSSQYLMNALRVNNLPSVFEKLWKKKGLHCC